MLMTVVHNVEQGLIYVANEYSTFVRIILMASQKLMVLHYKLPYIEDNIVCFDEKWADFKLQILQLCTLLERVNNLTP